MSPVMSLDKPDEIEHMASITLSTTPSDFNLDLFKDVDPEEIESYKICFPNLEKLADLKLHCTSCNLHIGTAPINEDEIRMHPVLRVIQCKKCFTFYNSGEFERGEDGSELYCRWCGQGGDVYCCSKCPYVFCRRCIVQNLSRNMVTEIENNDNWNCFACAPQCITQLRANHWALVNFIEKQKRQIADGSTNEIKIKKLMNTDISRCCNNSKKRSTFKRKIENLSAITPPSDEKLSIANVPPRSSKTALVGKSIKNITTSKDDSEMVQCTPDILCLFNNDEFDTDLTESQPIQFTGYEATVSSNQSGIIRSIPAPQQPTPPPTPIPTYSPLSTHSLPSTSNSAYHTVNGFRIDLNTAAQQENYRLPNGKIIQVKKLSTNVRQISPGQDPSIIIRSPIQALRPPPLPPPRPQLSAGISTGIPFQVSQPIFQQHHFSNGPIIQQRPAQTQQINTIHPPPLIFSTESSISPVRKDRTQFEERVDNSLEVCQHIIAKINTLNNSSSYKNIKSLIDIKDVTIHLSYLLTYAISQLQTLQQKCIEDMKNMGYDPNNNAIGNDDDDIQIQEPITTTINLDSDEEHEVPIGSTNNSDNFHHTQRVESINKNNTHFNDTAPNQSLICNSAVNTELQEHIIENSNNVTNDVVDLIDKTIHREKIRQENAAEKISNINDDFVQVLEIVKN